MTPPTKILAAFVLLEPCASCGGSDDMPIGAAQTGIIVTTGTATEEGDGNPRLDVGADTAGGAEDGGSVQGCKKVDVILAVDNSGSMSEELQALQGPVFDSFPQQLLAVNDGLDDFHLAVIDACPKPAYFHDTGLDGACGFSTGANYMSSTSPELTEEFACASELSPDGYMGLPDMCVDDGPYTDDDEQPGFTAASAVAGEAVEGANAGFLREDALLFIVTITDEDERLADVDTVQEIYDQIVSAKGGNVDRVVYLAVAGGSSCTGPYGSANDASNARALASMFEAAGRGLFWDLCMGDLELAFQTAIEVQVDSACAGFSPEG